MSVRYVGRQIGQCELAVTDRQNDNENDYKKFSSVHAVTHKIRPTAHYGVSSEIQ